MSKLLLETSRGRHSWKKLWVFVASCRLFPAAKSRHYSIVRVRASHFVSVAAPVAASHFTHEDTSSQKLGHRFKGHISGKWRSLNLNPVQPDS